MTDLQILYDMTQDGLEIVQYYFPQAVPGKNFSIRKDDKHPSASIKRIGGVWRLTDFGDEGKSKQPIDIVMEMERCGFKEAVALLAERYGLA